MAMCDEHIAYASIYYAVYLRFIVCNCAHSRSYVYLIGSNREMRCTLRDYKFNVSADREEKDRENKIRTSRQQQHIHRIDHNGT